MIMHHAERSSTLIAAVATTALFVAIWVKPAATKISLSSPSERSVEIDLVSPVAPSVQEPETPAAPDPAPVIAEPPHSIIQDGSPEIVEQAPEPVISQEPMPPPLQRQPMKKRVQEARVPPSTQTASSQASAADDAAAVFRSCLAAAPYPSSKDARLQKPAGSVGLIIAGNLVSITSSSGSLILDQAARARASLCAEAAPGIRLTGIVNYIPR